jgi:transcription-repair coupling factor (superfamily II helicase)
VIALHLLEQWRRSKRKGLLFLAEDDWRADQLGAILHAFAPESEVMVLPALDVFDGPAASPEITGRRATVLRRLAEQPEQRLLVATVEALLPRVPVVEKAADACLRLKTGQTFDEEALRKFLDLAGYSVGEPVETPGTALFLGQAVEVYPAGALSPVRIELANGQISAIRPYELDTQRVIAEQDDLALDAVSEWALIQDERQQRSDDGATVFDYLGSAIILSEADVDRRLEKCFRQREEATAAEFVHTPGFLDPKGWTEALKGRKIQALPELNFEPIPNFASSRSASKSLRDFLARQRVEGSRIIFTAATEPDMRAISRRAGLTTRRFANWQAAAKAKTNSGAALIVDLDRGFVDPRRSIAVIAAADVMGSRASHSKPLAVANIRDPNGSAELRAGDVVVHIDRGLAILHGLEAVTAEGVPNTEMVRLEFADETMVLTSVQELRSIWRYSSDATSVRLDKADGSSWQSRREEVERDIRQTASHLRKLASERGKRTAATIIPPAADYERFVASFRYFPTPDQSTAIEQVLADLASGHPMDRLVCGDVGYGKTEIALRAAAATVLTGKQVVVAVPTTVLAAQHLETFRSRFSAIGIEVGELSRFSSPAEARSIKKKLANGSLKVVIGTHALAAKGVKFADLGLVVIDEEQRFGLADKAKFAKLGENVHLLTLTATPIPRTLSQAYAGIRPISILATPPARRVAIKSMVEPFSEARVAAAFRSEHRRRGQSFLVCPRIEDIAPMQSRLSATVPELKVTTLHGKMPARDIDLRIMEFAAGKSDILLTTNIIENGLDLPRANTIVVWRPEKFGLAQLHQLRGRVGRRNMQAYAYFLSDPDARLTDNARKRLELLREFTRPGAGFVISSSDMDLRGGGDLLSERQSGHVKILGPALYRHMLERALHSGGGIAGSGPRPQLQLQVSGVLPQDYVKDETTRLQTYARIWKCDNQSELDEVEDQMVERFGELPAEAVEVLQLARIELDCLRLGIASINVGPKSIAAIVEEGTVDKRNRSKLPNSLQWKNGRLLYKRPGAPSDRLQHVRELVDILDVGLG